MFGPMNFNKPSNQVCFMQINNGIKQKILTTSVMTGHITALLNYEEMLRVCESKTAPETTHCTFLWLEITTTKDHNSLKVEVFHKWDF